MTSIEEAINARISESKFQATRYEKWLNRLKIPNAILIGGGSLAAFLGGARIVADKSADYAGFMALIGGALTGLHGWFGCETHQQKCRTIAANYSAFALKYERLKYFNGSEKEKEEKFDAVEDSYIEFIGKINAKPWL